MTERVVVITGASSGIGAALALELGEKATSLVLVARRADALEAVRLRSGPNAHAIRGDMTIRDDVRRVVREAVERLGRIDVWVNNVGQGISRAPSALTDDDVDSMVRVNIKSALYGMQEVLPHFKERGTGQVINISSMLGRVPGTVPRTAYTASKHFLNALTAGFRDEVAVTHPGIIFSLVSPGVVRTEFGRNALYGGPDSRALPDSQAAEEVATVIAGIIEAPRPDVYTRPGARERVLGYYRSQGEDPMRGS
jgi:NADP-dependent 3-hydroxy acid dehydrogenase YdfG